MGVTSRGNALSQIYAHQDNCEVIHICDMDSRAIKTCSKVVEKITGKSPRGFHDFLKSLEIKNIDPSSGHIIKDKKVQALWSRTYEKGWEMKL